MGFLDKAKAAAEQAAAKAKEGVDDVQTKRELNQTYTELGKTTFELIEAGELSNPRLTDLAAKVRDLNAKVAGDGSADAPATPGEKYDSTQPPAMPS